MTEQAQNAVVMQGMRKAFGATLAVDDVSFAIEPGVAHALLGENGAGKSTIVKLLSGLDRTRPRHRSISLAKRFVCVLRGRLTVTAFRPPSRR